MHTHAQAAITQHCTAMQVVPLSSSLCPAQKLQAPLPWWLKSPRYTFNQGEEEGTGEQLVHMLPHLASSLVCPHGDELQACRRVAEGYTGPPAMRWSKPLWRC